MSTSLALTLLATASLSLLPIAQRTEAAGCDPQVVKSHTHFPLRSQLRGQRGTVYLDVSVDKNGRATDARLHRSSGHRLLDRAAAQSVRKRWVFDVSSCERKDLPADHLVAVEYRNTEYGT